MEQKAGKFLIPNFNQLFTYKDGLDFFKKKVSDNIQAQNNQPSSFLATGVNRTTRSSYRAAGFDCSDVMAWY